MSLALVGAPVLASTVEESTGHAVAYQFDGTSHHDAPDTCEDSTPDWSLPVDGETDGMLLAPDDVADAFSIDIPSSLRGTRLTLAVTEATGAQGLALDAFAPGCLGSILDVVNWPHPEPTPPAPAAGQRQVTVASTEPDYCDSRQWIFMIDGLAGLTEPSSIYAAWTDGTEQAIDLTYRYQGYAFYATGDNLGFLLYDAWANLASSWAGHFRLVVGPCDAVDGGVVYGGPPTLDGGVLSFTPVRAGRHVVVVHAAHGLLRGLPAPVGVDVASLLPVQPADVVEGALHILPHDHASMAVALPKVTPLLPESTPHAPTIDVAPPGGLSGQMTCHFCVDGLEDLIHPLTYKLVANRAT